MFVNSVHFNVYIGYSFYVKYILDLYNAHVGLPHLSDYL